MLSHQAGWRVLEICGGFPCLQAPDLSKSLEEMSDIPWTPWLYFVDGFLEHLANADSESTQMRKADSTVSAAEDFPSSHIPPWAQFPHSSLWWFVEPIHSYSPVTASASKRDWRWIVLLSFLPPVVSLLSQLHCLVMHRETIVRLIRIVNAH